MTSPQCGPLSFGRSVACPGWRGRRLLLSEAPSAVGRCFAPQHGPAAASCRSGQRQAGSPQQDLGGRGVMGSRGHGRRGDVPRRSPRARPAGVPVSCRQRDLACPGGWLCPFRCPPSSQDLVSLSLRWEGTHDRPLTALILSGRAWTGRTKRGSAARVWGTPTRGGGTGSAGGGPAKATGRPAGIIRGTSPDAIGLGYRHPWSGSPEGFAVETG